MDSTYRVPLLDSKLLRLRYTWYYPIEYSFLITRDYYQPLQCRCMVSIRQVRVCGCSEACGEVVNNWLANLTRAIAHAQLQAMIKCWAKR